MDKYERETADDNINASSAPALKFTLQLCQPTPGHLKLMTDLQHLFSIIYNLLQFTMTIFYFSFSIASESQACHRCVTFKDFHPSIHPTQSNPLWFERSKTFYGDLKQTKADPPGEIG